MSFENWLTQTKPLMPVIVLEDTKYAVPLAKALMAGGVKFLEVTLRTEAALDCIRLLRKELPDAIVGAGTIVTPSDIIRVQEAGAMFAISPGISPELCKQAKESGMPYLPGVMTPSDVITGLEHGLSAFKFYPAEAAGGIKMLKALGGPFGDVWFCPTGGVNSQNAQQYLQQPNVRIVGGSWVCPPELIAKEDWKAIENLASDFLF